MGHSSKILGAIKGKRFIGSLSSLSQRVGFVRFYSLKYSVCLLLVLVITETVRYKIKWLSEGFDCNCFPFLLFL